MKRFLSILLFWGLVLFGPILVWLWNALSPASYHPGTLGYLVFSVSTQAIAVLIAWYAASHVFDGAHCKAIGINCVVGATLLVVLALSAVQWTKTISFGLAALAMVGGAVYCFQAAERDNRNRR